MACSLLRAESSRYSVFLQHPAKGLSMFRGSSRTTLSLRPQSLLRAPVGGRGNSAEQQQLVTALGFPSNRALHLMATFPQQQLLQSTPHCAAGAPLLLSARTAKPSASPGCSTLLAEATAVPPAFSAGIGTGGADNLKGRQKRFVRAGKNVTVGCFVFVSSESYSSQPCSFLYYK